MHTIDNFLIMYAIFIFSLLQIMIALKLKLARAGPDFDVPLQGEDREHEDENRCARMPSWLMKS